MAAPFQLNIITPERTFFSGETTQLTVRTSAGDIGILANHTSLVAALPAGPMKVRMENGEFRAAAVSGGLLKVGGNKATILATAVEWADEIDVEHAKRSAEDARQRLAAKESKESMDRAEAKLKRALNRINVSSMK